MAIEEALTYLSREPCRCVPFRFVLLRLHPVTYPQSQLPDQEGGTGNREVETEFVVSRRVLIPHISMQPEGF